MSTLGEKLIKAANEGIAIVKDPKFDSPLVKEQMIAVKYRREQEQTRKAGIDQVDFRGCAVEVYAGTGGLTKVYQEAGFQEIITNDINKNSSAKWHLDAVDFIKCDYLKYTSKIDLIDFDCYGCPAYAIQEFFKTAEKHAPFVLCFSDGFALWMKRNSKSEPIKKRYLIEGELNTEKIWWRHPQLIDGFFKKLAEQNDLKATKLIAVQTKHKNYTLGSYKFENI